MWVIATILIFTLTITAMKGQATSEITKMVETISTLLDIDVPAAIGTIATSVIVRYGAREVSANLKNKKYDSETEKGENAESTN